MASPAGGMGVIQRENSPLFSLKWRADAAQVTLAEVARRDIRAPVRRGERV